MPKVWKGDSPEVSVLSIYILPKQDATISGYDSQPSLRHIHRPSVEK